MENIEATQKLCWDRAFYAFGSSRVFARRANQLRSRRTWLVFLGIAIPLVVGGVVLSFSVNASALKWLIALASILSVIQLALSAWALVARWDERYESSVESTQNNYELFSRYETLARNPPKDFLERFETLEERNRAQERADTKTDLSHYERRYAMRHALIQFRRVCVSCKTQPKSLTEVSHCDLCGNLESKAWIMLRR
ncbi:hypothetical protein XarbCFBP8138_20150 [Xanthomonas arboricola]|uniref:mobilome CxxCx(11)CxxC protein n=1 Tax=Xanthomonas arboricola TaxID=56448 RepID=UPI0009BB22B6|nr:mobilome CxxCx(11)CxxC protein [Xanthomonas arboricola]PPT19557.1 hypothetical protein XarbCFBP7629_16015 [Xanthomonas arboricola]PPT53646.1 hypothetical protein XarbCFBP8138_20150 [Xanthomonas arboricola]